MINSPEYEMDNLLVYRSQSRRYDLSHSEVRTLLSYPNYVHRLYGTTPLMVSAWIGNTALVRALLEAGAQVNYQITPSHLETKSDRADLGYTALMYAAKSNSLEVFRMLCDAGADPNLITKYGATALSYALDHYCDTEILRLLLAHGSDPNAPDSFGVTPMFRALKDHPVHTSSLLLEYGADLAFEQFGRGVISHALLFKEGHADEPDTQAAILRRLNLLIKHGMDPKIMISLYHSFHSNARTLMDLFVLPFLECKCLKKDAARADQDTSIGL